MNEKTLLILRLHKEGKITDEEAMQLILPEPEPIKFENTPYPMWQVFPEWQPIYMDKIPDYFPPYTVICQA